ncbi:MAG: hypothetical protein HY556_09515 [Euryarchaeota archaeon]|nr:hypothetical protein [Euryarchaeota archaeon]
MGLVWEPLGIPGIVVGVLDVFLAWLVFTSRPDRKQNRLLALLFFLSVFIMGGRYGLRLLFDDPASAFAVYMVGEMAIPLWGLTYVAFLSTLDSPISRFLRRKSVQVGVAFLFAARGIYGVALTGPANRSVSPLAHFRGWTVGGGALLLGDYDQYLFYILWILGIVTAFSALMTARPGPHKDQMRWYTVAFVAQDAVLFSWLAYLDFLAPATFTASDEAILFLGPPLAGLLLDVFLAYGMLRTQLFDVDVRIKWTIKQSTVAAAFIAVFFIASEAAQQFFASSLGSYAGIVAAGLLVFAIAPLQRAADKVADAAMPRVNDTSEYLSFRKLEVYRAALEGAVADGVVTEREREILSRLRDKLGITDRDAAAMESDVMAAARGAA